MPLIISLALSAIAVFVAGYILPGVHVDGIQPLLVAVIVLAVVNTFIKPILTILTLPISVITLGLFLLVINALMIMLVDWLVPGFTVDSFWWALAFSIVLSLVGSVLGLLGAKPATK